MNDFDEICHKAMNMTVRLLARRNHTRYEIVQKLKVRGFDAEVRDAILSECERLNYLDDSATARFYLQELQRKGYGTHRIRLAMKKKGLSEELIGEMLFELNSEEDELENAHRVLQNKLRSFDKEKDARKRREKIYRFLYSRGFSKVVISEVMQSEKT